MYETFYSYDTPRSKFLHNIEKVYIKNVKALGGSKGYTGFDQMAMACCLNDSIIAEQETVFATVSTDGIYTRGQMVVDWLGHLKKKVNVRLATKMNQDIFVEMMRNNFKYVDEPSSED